MATQAASRAPAAAAPLDRAVLWTAEIEWYFTARTAGFRAAGRSELGAMTTFAVSQEFDWPLREPDAIEDVLDAVAELEAALLAAGWAPLEPGAGWYAKRFAYQRTRGARSVVNRAHRKARRAATRPAEPEPER